jgi:hypothetical protein
MLSCEHLLSLIERCNVTKGLREELSEFGPVFVKRAVVRRAKTAFLHPLLLGSSAPRDAQYEPCGSGLARR